jgi:flagellin FlaB
MQLRDFDEDAFTGLEAAIVLIAFVVVAAVFSYVVLGAGFFTTQKAQETVYKGVEQSTTNILIKGSIYGFASSAAGPIRMVNMTIGLAPGAPTIDLTKMKIVYSNATVQPTILSYSASAPDGSTTFYASATAMGTDDQVYIWIQLPSPAPPNTEMAFEIRPSGGGAPIPFTKSVPPATAKVNVLR